MHNRSILHRDIQLGNCVLGPAHDSQTIYMIDFGFSKFYIDPVTRRHIPDSKEPRDFIGNYWFSSVRVHCKNRGMSVFFVLVESIATTLRREERRGAVSLILRRISALLVVTLLQWGVSAISVCLLLVYVPHCLRHLGSTPEYVGRAAERILYLSRASCDPGHSVIFCSYH